MSLSFGLPVLWESRRPKPVAGGERRPAPAEAPKRAAVDTFRLSFHEEHLDEIGSLYYLRQSMLASPEAGFREIAECEQRLLNHADGVAMGRDVAFDLVASYVEKDDPADVFAGAFVLAMLSGPEPIDCIRRAWQSLEDEELLSALGDACMLAPHRDLAACMSGLMEDDRPLIREHAIAVLGARRELVIPTLRAALEDDDVFVRQRAAYYVPQGDESLVPLLAKDLHHESPLVQVAAAGGLLLLGRKEGLDYCRWRLKESGADAAIHRTAVLLAMAGGAADYAFLEDAWNQSGGSVELATALGLLGDIRAAALLVEALKHEDDMVVQECAAALERISGAGIFRESDRKAAPDLEAFEEEDEEDEDEAEEAPEATGDAESEQEAQPAAGLSYEVWYAYWRENLARYDRGARFRGGVPVHPSTLVEALSATGKPPAERALAHSELVMRTGNRSPFHAGDFVKRQRERIAAWEGWVAVNGQSFELGAWSFAGDRV